MNKFGAAFKRIAKQLDGLTPDLEARPFYELLSGALIWTDEKPNFQHDAEEMGAIRMIWNFRTSIILKSPKTEFQDLWTAASKLAPHWPVFIPSRLEPTERILQLIPETRKRQAQQGAAANP